MSKAVRVTKKGGMQPSYVPPAARDHYAPKPKKTRPIGPQKGK